MRGLVRINGEANKQVRSVINMNCSYLQSRERGLIVGSWICGFVDGILEDSSFVIKS